MSNKNGTAEIPDAIAVLVNAWRSDPDYRLGWVANIAVAFQDCAPRDWDGDTVHRVSNEAAERFLTSLESPPAVDSAVPQRLEDAEILYGFVGWLTSRKDPITMSSGHDAGDPVRLLCRFLDANGISDHCRPAFNEHLTFPPLIAGESCLDATPKLWTESKPTGPNHDTPIPNWPAPRNQ